MAMAAWTFIQSLSFSTRAGIVVFGAVAFGASLTTYVMFMPGHPYLMQVIASCIKVPALLLVCPLLALYPTLLLGRVFDKNVNFRTLLQASFACVVMMAICLMLFAPLMAALNSLGNYTLIIFSSYAAFAVAGIIGCVAFYFKLRRNSAVIFSSRSPLKVSAIWCVLLGFTGAEVGWSIRPFVGWTGQPFEWYRSDNTQIWNQLSAETQNLQIGGLSFPSKLEDPPHD
jgi:hypothetical protein